jgi:DNA end-binding protein Ku
VKPKENALVLELMHFAHELLETTDLDLPKDEAVGKKELDMAKALVESMSSKWEADKYQDEYTNQLLKVIDEKVEAGGKDLPKTKTKTKPATNVVDLVAILKKSIEENTGKGKKKESHAHKKLKKAA